MPDEVFLLLLTYDIMFTDADEGQCYAGDGRKVLEAYSNLTRAEAIVAEFNPILIRAELEHIVFPVQPFNKQLQKRFGFTLGDLGSELRGYKLIVETHELKAG